MLDEITEDRQMRFACPPDEGEHAGAWGEPDMDALAALRAAPMGGGGAEPSILGSGGLPNAGPGDLEYVPLIITGPSENRVDIWFVGDGYTADDREQLLADVEAQMAYLFGDSLADPFGRYQDLFNVHVVVAESAERGADRPEDGVYVDTAFDASYSWNGGVTRCLYLDTGLANAAVEAVRPEGVDVDMRLGVVNSDIYGGCGGSWAVYAAGAPNTGDLALHELGHSFGRLADEYWSPGETHGGGEPWQANVTADPTGAKWERWLGFDDGVLGPIGAYEGGLYVENGIYRPTLNSKMRALGEPFDAIAKEAFILQFYFEVDPIDAYAFEDVRFVAGGGLVDEYAFWIDTISADFVAQEWSVDGVLIEGAAGEALSLGSLGLAPGTYTLTARAFDDTDMVRMLREELEQTVSWDVTLNYWAFDGTEANDALTGEDRADRLDGLDGADVIAGLGGDDWLIGGAGADLIEGGAGADLIEGGAGADVIYGDAMV